MVPMLVPAEVAPAAAALTGTIMLLGMTVGSALGGILVGAIGASATFAINAVSFVADVVLLSTIRVGPSPRVGRADGQVRAGVNYLWRTPILRATMIAFALLATFGFTVQVSVPILVRLSFDGGPELVGAAFTAGTAGSLAGMVAAAVRRSAGPPPLAPAAAGLGVGLLLIAVAPAVPVLLIALAVTGFAWSVCILAATATLQTADPAMTGRVMAIFAAVLLGGTAVGGPIAAALADQTDPRAPFVVGAIAAACATFLAHHAAARSTRHLRSDTPSKSRRI
jgi:predicted MFS family arabinose efflux permease